jgi:hypothetical protein
VFYSVRCCSYQTYALPLGNKKVKYLGRSPNKTSEPPETALRSRVDAGGSVFGTSGFMASPSIGILVTFVPSWSIDFPLLLVLILACTKGGAAIRLTRKPAAQACSGPDLSATLGEVITAACLNCQLPLECHAQDEKAGGSTPRLANCAHYAWQSHCHGLVRLSVAA